MKRTLFLLCAILVALGAGNLPAQVTDKPSISVNSSAKVTARADLAIVFMAIHTTAPLAADALEQNNKRVQAVKDRLAALGYKGDQVRFSGNLFTPAGGRTVAYGDQRPTGFDVSNNLFIYLDGPELNDLQQFNSRLSALLDEMSKLGATPVNFPILSPYPTGSASVVAFTVKDPTALEKQAYQQAWKRARPMADGIAQGMNVQITSIASVSLQQQNSTLDRFDNLGIDIPYKYFSSSMNEVPVRVSLYVRYFYK
ncbi:MAG: SIMPL domain-containing protein [Terriglobia bacterium]|jgi:uncharacterized protein YggE